MTARATAQPLALRTAQTAVHTAVHSAVHSAVHTAVHTAVPATGRCFAHAPDGAGVVGWQTSSYSNAEGGNCVEVAQGAGADGVVPVRDSKRPSGPALVFEPGAWSSFVQALKGRKRDTGAP